MIAGVFAIAGERPWLLAVRKVFLAAATALLAGRLSESLAGPRAAFATVYLLGLDPATFHASTVVMSDVPFTLLVLGAYLEDRRAARAALRLGAFAMPLVLFVGGWQLRNLARAGGATFSHDGRFTLYSYRSALVEAERTGLSLTEQQRRQGWDEFLYRFGYSTGRADSSRPAEAGLPGTASMSAPQLSRACRDQALAVLRSHPLEALKVHAKGLLLLYAAPPTIVWAYMYDGFHPDPETADANLTARIGRTARLLWSRHRGLAVLTSPSFLPLVMLLVPLLYLSAIQAGPEALDARLRVPLVPFLAVYAGVGLAGGPAARPASGVRRVPGRPPVGGLIAGEAVSVGPARGERLANPRAPSGVPASSDLRHGPQDRSAYRERRVVG